jgi:uncharacterized protein YegL
MKKRKIVYHLLVDESSSMCDCEEITVNGINEQINKIKNIESEFPDEDILIGLTTFNDKITHHFIKTKPSEIQLLKAESFEINGSTALLDAIGQTIEIIENQLKISNSFFQIKVVMIILTDGFDNCSKYFNYENIKSSILRLEKTGCWNFSFIGANFNTIKVVGELYNNDRESIKFEKMELSSLIWKNLCLAMKTIQKIKT